MIRQKDLKDINRIIKNLNEDNMYNNASSYYDALATYMKLLKTQKCITEESQTLIMQSVKKLWDKFEMLYYELVEAYK